MINAIQKPMGTTLRLVSRERDARMAAIKDTAKERNLRAGVEQKLAEVTAKATLLAQQLQAEREGRLIAETRLQDAQQTIEALRAVKPFQPKEPKPDPAIPRIEAAVLALLEKPAPVIDMTGMTFDIRRDEFGKPKQIVLKEK